MNSFGPLVRRRYLQFGMGTLLLVVTAVAVWLGLELQNVRERERLIRSTDFLRLFEYREKDVGVNARRRGVHVAGGPPPQMTIPFLWKLAGDKAIENMDLFLPSDRFTAADARRIQALFPECAVRIISVGEEGFRRSTPEGP